MTKTPVDDTLMCQDEYVEKLRRLWGVYGKDPEHQLRYLYDPESKCTQTVKANQLIVDRYGPWKVVKQEIPRTWEQKCELANTFRPGQPTFYEIEKTYLDGLTIRNRIRMFPEKDPVKSLIGILFCLWAFPNVGCFLKRKPWRR